ncbi:MAG: SCO family protein [Bryobacterales bacterium]|nr:SCO family protein [Bryobacterales bacterium]
MRFRAGWAALPAILLLLVSSCARRPTLPDYGAVPDFLLISESGQNFSSRQLLTGKIWIADFIYTHCTGPCPLMSARMRRIQESVRRWDDVRLVSFTVDPERDSPGVLAAYSARFHAEPSRWFFLTGRREVLEQLNRHAFKLGSVDATLEHSTRFALVDRSGHVRGYFHSGDPDSMAQLLDAVSTLRGMPS